MLVRDGMNPIVVTVGPAHTLREASRRMTARGVGAAVVTDNEQPGPGIITERDILSSNGVGQDIDAELVCDHLTSQLVYAAADWPLERAAEEMVRGGFRHVIVLDGPEIVGILSMRDIVRCWTSDGASCAVRGSRVLAGTLPCFVGPHEGDERCHRRAHGAHGGAQDEPWTGRRWILQAQLAQEPRSELGLDRRT